MGSSRTAAPLTDNSDMASDANAAWPAQNSEDMMRSNGQQFDAMPMDFEFGPTVQEFGALPDYSALEGGLTGYDYSSSSNFINNMNGDDMIHGNHFNGNFEEVVSAKTPGYHNIDAETAEHLSSVVHNSTPAHSVHNYHSYGAQTPFQPSIETYDAKTPYVAPTPYTSPNHSSSGYAGGEIPDLDLDDNGALPSEDFGPGPSPMEETFPTSRPSTPPTPKSGPTKKTSTPRKAKSKAKAAIASKQDEDTDEGRSLLSTRGKGKGKAKQPVILDDEEELDDNEGETLTTGSNKGKGRKRAAAPKTPKTPTSTPSKKSKTGTAAKKSTKKTTADDLSTMGHQRVRKAPKDGIAQVKPIPHSFDECDIADQTLITMRDAGHTWNECKARYAELEGVTHGNSTIPNRYERLKTAFINMREEDNLRLFNIKKKLEDDFNSKKWALIAAEIIKDGGAEYDPDDLRRRFKQLMEKSGFPVEEGLAKEDVDFKINVDDEGEEDQQESPEPMRKQPEITWMGDEDEEDDALGGGEQEDYEDTSYTQHRHRRNSRESAHMDVDDDEDEVGDDLAY
ncbi:hypothetical protein E4T50_17182 [Aureobasidium sp. EXF-12298]|nr:hypothetical protein E4T50_17182 [Aureobasidium sp. EXF-12298]KAI4749896.1 hypothetical protein E4T51_16708 [Aureobasidium sp. EXF-12344]KAI4772515.1 hypothetical protein E4T52_12481 [Aureobasidium sp. EXF-3400]